MERKRKPQFLKLDSFDIHIPFSNTRGEIIALLQEKNVSVETPGDAQAAVKSKLFSLDVDFFVAFQFHGEKLIAVTMSPEKALEGRSLYTRYKKIQKALEKEFGRPFDPLRAVLNFLDPDSRSLRWKKGGIAIEHDLLNRFGMEETVRIQLH